MPLNRSPYDSLDASLARVRIVEEDPEAAKIIKRLTHVRKDKELSRGEFLDICYWKSSRSIRRCEKNSGAKVEKVSRLVFGTRSERDRLDLLTSLEGVSVPTASAILTLTNPTRYGVIDIRVWQLLYALGSVNTRPSGVGFGFAHWYKYLQILRSYSRKLRVSVRRVELTLFQYHQNHQAGRLYI